MRIVALAKQFEETIALLKILSLENRLIWLETSKFEELLIQNHAFGLRSKRLLVGIRAKKFPV